MSTLWTDYAENKLVDKTRGTEPTYPTNWYIGLLSAAADGSYTEVTGVNLARVAVTRSLAKWAGTQGAGTTLASSGTSHATSNNDPITFGTATANLTAPATHLGLFDALSSGNLWAYLPIPGGPLTVLSGDSPSFDAGTVQFIVGDTPGCSNYLSNKLIDEFFRAQAYAWPATTYEALYTVSPGQADIGTEVSGGSYARVARASSMANWSGTQAAGSTSASSGSSGLSSNNAAITFPAPTADWGAVVAGGTRDASSGGNLLLWGDFASPRSIANGGAAPSYAPAQRVRGFL